MVRDTICRKLRLQPAEFFMLIVALSTLSIDLILIAVKGAQVDAAAYGSLVAMVMFTAAVGMFYRISGRSERLASAAMCSAIFIFFSACLSLYNYLLLPITRPLIDIPIAQIDALFGYHWPNIMQLAAEYPIANMILKIAYTTTIPQFALLVLILGLTGRLRDLHVMLTAVTITATLTICFWGLFPTLGAKSMYILPPELWAAVNPIVDEAYAKELLHIGAHGPGVISPKEIRGLIAFPSYHAVLAFIAIYSARNIPIVCNLFLILNLLILPGIFIHGGHHFLDLFGGFAMFVFGTWLAVKSVNNDYSRLNKPEFVTA